MIDGTFDILDIWQMLHLTYVTFPQKKLSSKLCFFFKYLKWKFKLKKFRIFFVSLIICKIFDRCDIWQMRLLTYATFDIWDTKNYLQNYCFLYVWNVNIIFKNFFCKFNYLRDIWQMQHLTYATFDICNIIAKKLCSKLWFS